MKTRCISKFLDALHVATTRRSSSELPSNVSLVLVDYSRVVTPHPARFNRVKQTEQSSDIFLRDLEYIND
jgi:hypothetical protein